MARGGVFRIKARGYWRATQVHEPTTSAAEKKQKHIAVPSSDRPAAMGLCFSNGERSLNSSVESQDSPDVWLSGSC